MKISALQAFDGIRFEHTCYRCSDKDEYCEYRRDIEAIGNQLLLNGRRFSPRNEALESVLGSYGPSEVVIEYLSENLTQNKEGQIIRSFVADGKQAINLIEHCINNYGKIRGTPFQGNLPLQKIEFAIDESDIWRRTLFLKRETVYPQLLCTEMNVIIIAELNNYVDKEK